MDGAEGGLQIEPGRHLDADAATSDRASAFRRRSSHAAAATSIFPIKIFIIRRGPGRTGRLAIADIAALLDFLLSRLYRCAAVRLRLSRSHRHNHHWRGGYD